MCDDVKSITTMIKQLATIEQDEESEAILAGLNAALMLAASIKLRKRLGTVLAVTVPAVPAPTVGSVVALTAPTVPAVVPIVPAVPAVVPTTPTVVAPTPTIKKTKVKSTEGDVKLDPAAIKTRSRKYANPEDRRAARLEYMRIYNDTRRETEAKKTADA
jgi:hypothetical protein